MVCSLYIWMWSSTLLFSGSYFIYEYWLIMEVISIYRHALFLAPHMWHVYHSPPHKLHIEIRMYGISMDFWLLQHRLNCGHCSGMAAGVAIIIICGTIFFWQNSVYTKSHSTWKRKWDALCQFAQYHGWGGGNHTKSRTDSNLLHMSS